MRRLETVLLVKNRRLRRAARHNRMLNGARRSLWALLAAGLSLLGIAALGLSYFYAQLSAGLPSVYTLERLLDPTSGALTRPTRLYDRSGQVVLLTLENPGVPRRYLYLNPARGEAFNPLLVDGVIALFDPLFWQRSGVRWENLDDPRPATLAERLAEEWLMPPDEPPGWQRTLRLRLLADQIINTYGKEQVLEWYLNSAPFGHLTYGADSAAQAFLGKPASSLNPAEVALLLAALESPALNPLDAPAAALENQQTVLLRMLGLGLLDQTTYQQARQARLDLKKPLPLESKAPAFTTQVINRLAEWLGRNRLERGGLRIITSLDASLQAQVVCTLQTQLARLNEPPLPAPNECEAARLLPALPLRTPRTPGLWQASAVILDPLSGEVLAFNGDTSAQGESSQQNPHPPGSLQNPFLALAGFARGLSPATLVWDIPLTGEGETADEPPEEYNGPLRLRNALVNDDWAALRTVYAQIGAAALTATVHNLGIEQYRLPAEEATLLSEGEALPLVDLAHAYSVFATLGSLNGVARDETDLPQPRWVLRVEDYGGNSLPLPEQTVSRPVVSSPLAYLVHHVLSDEAARWRTLGYPNPLEIGRPAGAKSGQALDGRVTWAAGYTPQTVAVVWLGSEAEDSPQPGVFPVAGIWHALMQYLHHNQPVQSWPVADGVVRVEVCDPSGLLPGDACPSRVSEVFLENSQPSGVDTLYRRFQINRETGRLATVFTPPELVEERVFLVVPPQAQAWARAAGLPLPPGEYDLVQQPPPNPHAQITQPRPFSVVGGEVEIYGTASGEDFAAYSLQIGQGINPTAWVSIQESTPQAVENGRLAVWNTRNLEGLYVIRLLVIRRDQRVETSLLQVTVDNTPPQVRIPYPLEGQVFIGQSTITLQAEVSDAVGLARVEWRLDGRTIGEASQPPFALVWDARRGEHRLEVVAVDLAGNQTVSEPVQFRVR